MKIYPMLTTVLYFGWEQHWKKPRSLKECFKNMHPALEPFVSDYRINVIEVAWLPDDVIAKFANPFRQVAEYFSSMRKGEDYQPSEEYVRHAKEMLDLMSLLTNDVRFKELKDDVQEGESVTMRSILLDKIEARGLEKGIEKGMKKGRQEGIAMTTLKFVRNQLKRHVPYQQIAENTETPLDEVLRIAKKSGMVY